MIYINQNEDPITLYLDEKADSLKVINTLTKAKSTILLQYEGWDREGYRKYQINQLPELDEGEYEYTSYREGVALTKGLLKIEGTPAVKYQGTYTDLNVIQYGG